MQKIIEPLYVNLVRILNNNYLQVRKSNINVLFTTIFQMVSSGVFAQRVGDTATEKLDTIFTIEGVKPSFKEGNKALNKYLTENLNTDAQKGEEGCKTNMISQHIASLELLAGIIRSRRRYIFKKSSLRNMTLIVR